MVSSLDYNTLLLISFDNDIPQTFLPLFEIQTFTGSLTAFRLPSAVSNAQLHFSVFIYFYLVLIHTNTPSLSAILSAVRALIY
jgi:hypothetical protein